MSASTPPQLTPPAPPQMTPHMTPHMTPVVRALVVSALAATAVLVLGVALGSAGVMRAGLVAMLCVPVVRNVAFAVVERRRAPRALAVAVGILLVGIYVWFLRGGAT